MLGDFRHFRTAVLDSWAGRPISAPLEHSQLIRDLAGGHRHELTENTRSDPGIFNFVKWLRVGEKACPAGAGQGEAEGALPLQARVAGHHAGHQPQQAYGRERSGKPRPGAGGLQAPRVGSHGVLRVGTNQTAPQNSPQSMRVWPGLRLMKAGRKIPKGVFVAVAEVEPDGVRLDNGMRLKNQELLRATRPSHAVTYASCQGLTLHNCVRLDLESCHLTLRHLYVGASQATSSELLEAA